MRLSIAIMAVPSRRAHAETLRARVASQAEDARRVGLDVVDPVVFYDESRNGPWFCWRGAWLMRDRRSTHHVVIQDDVATCADLPAALVAMARARPGDPVSGFLPRRSVEHAVRSSTRWVATRRFLWAQCLMLPAWMGDDALAWIAAREGDRPDWRHHDDSRLAAFFADERRRVFVAVPHPVEHIGDAIGGSVMGHNGPAAKRRARPGAWLGEEVACAGFDWSRLDHVRE